MLTLLLCQTDVVSDRFGAFLDIIISYKQEIHHKL